MKIGLRGGHSKNAVGAIKLRNEYNCMQELYKATRDEFVRCGNTVIDCNSNANSENGELYEGANKANSANVDIFISLHMNAFNSSANGTEIYVSNGSSIKGQAQAVLQNLCAFGWFNRGVKETNKLYECNRVNAPNMLIEVCFCDSEKDIAIFSPTSYEDMAKAIVRGVIGDTQATGTPNSTLKPNYYALEECVVRDGSGNHVGYIYKDEEFNWKWTEDAEHGYKKCVEFAGGNGYLKQGYLDAAYKICKIGEVPEVEKPLDPKPEEPKVYKVVIECGTKERAELLKDAFASAKIEEV